jgi:hypothetical protein
VPDDALAAVTEEMIVLHERYHGRKPATALLEEVAAD